MELRRISLVLLAVLAIGQPLRAADPSLYAEGTNHLYNLDFADAERDFLALTRDHPENPDYWNALASTYWLRLLYDQQKLSLESFASRDRFGTTESSDKADEAEEQRLRDAVNRAIAAADAILRKDPKNLRALYAKGVSQGTLASYEATIKRSYLSAAHKAKAARNLHRDVLKLDPDFHDARSSVGIYNYAVGSLSFPTRMLLLVVGLGGDGKEEGIKDLETAAARGERAAVNAKMLLVVVYSREQQFEKALRLINELHAKYPRNFMFDMSKGSIYGRMKRWDLAAQTFREVADKIRTKTDGYDRMRLERAYFELANAQFQGQKFDESARTFALVIQGEKASPNEKATAHLWIGRMADTRGDRDEALRHYRAIEPLDCDQGIKNDARKHIRRPFG